MPRSMQEIRETISGVIGKIVRGTATEEDRAALHYACKERTKKMTPVLSPRVIEFIAARREQTRARIAARRAHYRSQRNLKQRKLLCPAS